MLARSFTFSTQSNQKGFIDGNRFLAPVDFPLGYIYPRISANALAEPHLAGFERLKALSTFSRIYSSQVVTSPAICEIAPERPDTVSHLASVRHTTVFGDALPA